ncbi:nitric oxide synthase oxygenase [Deinococcus sp. SM5_A1]|uniref:nitric oxide synthase oxygenase n=1 Tax=Deinococcus sp. SM5_A1 TaxID=3379094 RepID=UPI00385E91D1
MPASPVSSTIAGTDAEQFLRLYHGETGRPGLTERLERLRLGGRDNLDLSTAELTFGARVAWRNSIRCVGRLPWAGLRVRDLRHVIHADEVFGHLVRHLHASFAGGRIQPTISVFGPGVRIHNDQLLRYAGYRQPGGGVVGDPQNVALTQHLRQLGWEGGAGTPFDLLPLAIEARGRIHLFSLPTEAAPEIQITHPNCESIGKLGLRWPALPVVSNMTLGVGGQHFVCAPFSGWYMQTEIASRNLADADRYDVLPAVAQALGLDMGRRRSLWLDRALLELNVAVLHSFDMAGVRIIDHHAATRQFQHFETCEAAAGRTVYGHWSWLIPPPSPASTPIWSRQYDNTEVSPNFLLQRPAWETSVLTTSGCPFNDR